MHRNVETLIGRLATDARLRRCFTADPERVLSGLQTQGLELTAVELAALVATDPEALRSFAASLDRRLCRASPSDETARATGTTRTNTPDQEPKR